MAKYLPYERGGETGSPKHNCEMSPELRYMTSPNDEPNVSPYDKSISTEEIKQRINQSLQQQSFSREKKAVDDKKGSEFSYTVEELPLEKCQQNFESGDTREESEMNNRLMKESKENFNSFKYEYKSKLSQSNLPFNTSQELLTKFLEGHSPNKENLEDKLLTHVKLIEEKFHTTNTILEQFVDLTTAKEPSQREPKQYKNRLEKALEVVCDYLGQVMTIEDQSVKFANCINNDNGDIKLGGVVGCYIIWKAFPKEVIGIVDKILQNIFTQLIHYEAQEQAFLICCLELVGFIGANEISCNAVSIIRAILLSAEDSSDLQTTSINTLLILHYPGLHTLIDIINKGDLTLRQSILSRLCSIPLIQVLFFCSHRNIYSSLSYSMI